MPGITVPDIVRMKADGRRIVMVTAYDYAFARLADEAGVDVVLVGDSLGMVVQGHSTTLPVTVDQMVYHTTIVRRGVEKALVVGDMPFLSYQANRDDAVWNAGRFLKEAGAAAVKLEGGVAISDTIASMVKADIPVMGHVGLRPQAVHAMGGYKVQGRGLDAQRVLDDALAVEAAGAFSIVLEGVPAELAARITGALKIPTIGIGAGSDCDGQVLVMHDMLGLFDRPSPKFSKRYADLGAATIEAFRRYGDEVRSGKFPGDEHTIA
ncbi:MAG: 3-methyl-2-oxobutanoate hydroxymethyltransferase [Nitrospirota bacterium]|nr:3-methyl-2-oxobutanoate hydroxymethyltransferase [Nitrospirota bacterium]